MAGPTFQTISLVGIVSSKPQLQAKQAKIHVHIIRKQQKRGVWEVERTDLTVIYDAVGWETKAQYKRGDRLLIEGRLRRSNKKDLIIHAYSIRDFNDYPDRDQQEASDPSDADHREQ